MSLYQDLILDHYRNPRNAGTLPHPTGSADAINLSCGDKLHMDIALKNDKILDIRFSGSGCAISLAAASLLTEHVKGKTAHEALGLEPKHILEILGITLSTNRLKCGLLSLETLKKALAINTK